MRNILFFTAVTTGILVAASGCGGNVESATGGSGGTATGGAGGQSTTATGGTTASGGSGGTTASGGACAGYQGQATLAEIADSPFADEESEVLAIEASGKIVAPKHVYERIVADLAAIRAQEPSVQSVKAMTTWFPEVLQIELDPDGHAAVQAGTYTAWDCANAWYGFTGAQVTQFEVFASFSHRYNPETLGKEYAMFEHVTSAVPEMMAGDGDDVCVSIQDDKTFNYVFDHGIGDCPAGCTMHTYWGFKTEGPPLTITPLGTFTNQDATPAWFSALPACTKWL